MRLSETDKASTEIVNDGGSVAKTGDTLKSKISKWEGWVKEKSVSPIPRTSFGESGGGNGNVKK